MNMPYKNRNVIWQVGANGEAAVIARGVSVLANSRNGRHWLLMLRMEEYSAGEQPKQLYVMTLDDTASL